MNVAMGFSKVNSDVETIKSFLNDKVIGKTFEVTQQDIDNGERSSSTSCPISLSMDRGFGNATAVYVNYGSANILFIRNTGESSETINLSIDYTDDIRNWILSFDEEREVKPINLRVIKGNGETTGKLVLA